MHRANDMPVRQQVRRKRVAERVARDSFRQPGLSNSLLDSLLDERLVNVMSSLVAGFRIAPAIHLRKHLLPNPFTVGIGVLAGQRVRKFQPAVAVGHVLLVTRQGTSEWSRLAFGKLLTESSLAAKAETPRGEKQPSKSRRRGGNDAPMSLSVVDRRGQRR